MKLKHIYKIFIEEKQTFLCNKYLNKLKNQN